jgi:hypothetical protein
LGRRSISIPKRELLAIADASGVPMWFLEGGWDGWRASEGSIDKEGRSAMRDLDSRGRPKAEGE